MAIAGCGWELDDVMNEERYLAAVRVVAADRQAFDEREHIAIDNARAAGATWLQIATALGKNSPQAAFQRFKRIGKRIDGNERQGT